MMDRAKIAGGVLRMAPRAPLQRLYDVVETLSLLGMNIGSATQSHETNGERYALEAIAGHYSGGDSPVVVFDVGANAGHYGTMIGEVFGDRVALHSFEPDPVTFAELNRALGRVRNFRSFNVALGGADASMTFYVDPINTALSSLHRPRDHGTAERIPQPLIVPVRALDSLCNDLKISHIDLLKIDVEGGELAVLQGAAGLLHAREIDFIQFEFGERNIDSRTFFLDFYQMLNPDYRLYRILPRHLERIHSYKPRHEIFVSATNYLAVSEAIASRSVSHWG